MVFDYSAKLVTVKWRTDGYTVMRSRIEVLLLTSKKLCALLQRDRFPHTLSSVLSLSIINIFRFQPTAITGFALNGYRPIFAELERLDNY